MTNTKKRKPFGPDKQDDGARRPGLLGKRPGPVTREEAYAIAIVYLGTQMLGRIEIVESIPENHGYWMKPSPAENWIVKVADDLIGCSGRLDGPGPRYVAISRKTGDIVFDDRAPSG